MNKQDIEHFKRIVDNVSGSVHCQQCATSLNIDDVEFIDGFMFCTNCGYEIARGD